MTVTKSIQILTQIQARSLVERIRSHINDARALVLELHEKEGWRALGYDSWRECVVAEFDQSQSRLYQLLDAARVEKNILPMGENSTTVENGEHIPERVLRPLTSLPPAQQREAWSAATAIMPKPTAAVVEQAAKMIQSAIEQAYDDTKDERAARTPIPGKENPEFDNRWIQFVGAVGAFGRIENFDAKAIVKQQTQVTAEDCQIKRRISQCRSAVEMIEQFLIELETAYPHVFSNV